MPTSLLFNWRVWAAVAIAVMLAASHWKAYKMGEFGVRNEWAADQLSQAEQTNQLQADAARSTILRANGGDTMNARLRSRLGVVSTRPWISRTIEPSCRSINAVG